MSEPLHQAADLARDNPPPSGTQNKNIVICCDGTGNEFGDANSNVIKLYSTLVINQRQIGYYRPGVGTMGAPTARGRIGKAWTRIKGLAFGAGLLDNVADAYRYLMDVMRMGTAFTCSDSAAALIRCVCWAACCTCSDCSTQEITGTSLT